MLYIIYTFLAVAVLNALFIWFKKNYTIEVEKITKIGQFSARIGIEEPDCRDFDLTISGRPLEYFQFQFSLWSVYCGCEWQKDPDSCCCCDNDAGSCCG